MTPAADDFEVIRKRLGALRGQWSGKCAIREGKGSSVCWCYMAGPNGETLPCPPGPEAEAHVQAPTPNDEFCYD